jgi:hypothetical protein
MTFKPLTADLGEAVLMSFLAAFPAQTYHQLGPTAKPTENILELTAKVADFGRKCDESLQKLGHRLLPLKTPRCLELAALSECSKTLPRWGMMRDGGVWEVGLLARTTSGTGCGLLPTPTAHNSKEGAYPAEFTRRTKTLAAQVGGKINPDWNEARMAWPIKWTDLGALETDKMHKWQHLHGQFLANDLRTSRG